MSNKKENRNGAAAAADMDAEMQAELEGRDTGTQVVPAQGGGEVAAFQAQGITLRYSFVLVGNGKSMWKTDEGRKPNEGDLYLRKSKEVNYLVGECGSGPDKGVAGIIVAPLQIGWKESPKGDFNPLNPQPPRRFWTKKDLVEAGLSDVPKQVGTYKDSGNPIMKADAAPFCYLRMLMRLPEDFPGMDFQVFKVGGALYTPVVIEFDRGNFVNRRGTGISQVISNWRERAMLQHSGEEGYEFSPVGQMCRVRTAIETSRATGFTFTSMTVGAELRDGRLFTFTDDERADYDRIVRGLSEATVDASEVDDGNGEF